MAKAGTDDLEPRVRAGQLSPAEHEARKRRAGEYEAAGQEAEARTAAALGVGRSAVDALGALHGEVAERYRFEIGADTRWSAGWELSAAALGYANAMIVLLEDGFHLQIAPLYRSVHEALGLLWAFRVPEEEAALIRKFVDGKAMRSGDGHGALKREVERAKQAKRAEGISSETVQINEQAGQMYGHLSEAAHLRRTALGEFVDAPLREAFVGQHGDPRVTAEYAEQGLLLLEQVVMIVGWTLGTIAGEEFYDERVAPILKDVTGLTHDPALFESLPD